MFKVFEKPILHSNPDKVFLFNQNSESISNVIYELNNHLSTKYPIEILSMSMDMQLNRTQILRPLLNSFFLDQKKNETFIKEIGQISGLYSIKGLNVEEFERIIVKQLLKGLSLSNPIDCSTIFQAFSENKNINFTSDWFDIEFNYIAGLESAKKEIPYIYSLLESSGVVNLLKGNQRPSSLVLLSIESN